MTDTTEGLPLGAWQECIGLSSACQLCPTQDTKTLQYAFQDCTKIKKGVGALPKYKTSSWTPTGIYTTLGRISAMRS
jgi:hypothetical protein